MPSKVINIVSEISMNTYGSIFIEKSNFKLNIK